MIRVAFVIGGYPPEEHKRRAEVALSYSTQEIQVGIVHVAASPYFYGMTPSEIQLVAPAFIESFKRAEKEGYDAVVPLGTLDLGVDGGKMVAVLHGDDVQILRVTSNRFPYTLIAARGAKGPKDLMDGRIAVNRLGDVSAIASRVALRKLGLNPDKDVTMLQRHRAKRPSRVRKRKLGS